MDDLTPEEKAEWLEDLEDAANAIRDRMKRYGATPVQAAEQMAKRRPWNKSADLLQEALNQIMTVVGAVRTPRDGTVLVDDSTRKVDNGWYEGPDLEKDVFWPPVREAIARDLGEQALASVDEMSNQVIANAGLPAIQDLRTRGLVVGFVQSGKTTNFLSVIAKAADEGYRLIIVLAGMTDSLREQTQKRLLDSLVSHTDTKWILPTGIDRDFSGTDDGNLLYEENNPRQLIVIKKNGPRLNKLNKWLDKIARKQGRLNFPILVIDDEADQASINVANTAKEEMRRSAINAQIRTLLSRPRTSYIAYTATPFANILIDPNDKSDLYPENFISVLPRPKGYFGTEQLFGRDPLPGEDPEKIGNTTLDAIRDILPDEEDSIRPPSRKIDSWAPTLPDSLRDAVRWFLLATATRWARGQRGEHSSMLVHSSPRVHAHELIAEIVNNAINEFSRSMNTPEFRKELEEYWDWENSLQPQRTEYETITFDQVWENLREVLDEVEPVVDNGESENRVDYSTGAKTIIAVGGNTLSRGLTLEGLVCSYFARVSRTYDTLLQMGRWFGFRHGYEDLVRIWMTPELAQWYRGLATVEEDLRRDLSWYASDGLTPAQFRAKIRLHPSMQVTNAAKMKTYENESMGFSGQRVQTIVFREKDPEFLGHNVAVTRNFITHLRETGKRSWHREANGSTVFTGLTSEEIIDYLQKYLFIEDVEEKPHGKSRWDLLIDYIAKESENGELRSWNVSVIGQQKDKRGTIDLGLENPLNLVNRSRISSSTVGRASINTLVGPKDRINDLPFRDIEWKHLDSELQHKGRATDTVLRNKHDEYAGTGVGHLTIYAINRNSAPDREADPSKVKNPGRIRRALEAVDDIVGLGVFMPESDDNSGVGYICGIDNITEEELEETWDDQTEYEDTVAREDAADNQEDPL